MDNKSMKSFVIVVLPALLFGLVGQALAAAPSSYHCFDPNPSEKLTIDKLLSKLGSTFQSPFSLSKPFVSVGHRVFSNLESTKEKNEAGTILGQYSVQQLLDLNTWTVGECSNEAVEKRRQKCESFCSLRQADDVDPPRSMIEVNRQDAFVKHNLGNYCWAIVDKIQNECPFKQLEVQISQDDLNRLWDLFLKAHREDTSDPRLASLNIEGTQKGLTKYMATKKPSEVAELWAYCSIMVGVFDAPRSYDFRITAVWIRLIRFCKQFNNSFTLEGHSKDNL